MTEISELTEKKSQEKWDRIYNKADASVAPSACEVLTEYQHLIPSSGSALDIACGLGGNSLFLAERGFNVTAIDISAVAIERIEAYQNARIQTRCCAIDRAALKDLCCDIIVVSRYLDRQICSALIDSLLPGGLLFYQTFTQEKAIPGAGPSNPEFLLSANELLSLFAGLKVLAFTDQGKVGTLTLGFRNQSYLVAQKD